MHSVETQEIYAIIRERIKPHLSALAACRNSAELWGLDLYRALEPDIRRVLDTPEIGNFRRCKEAAPARRQYRFVAWNVERGAQFEGQVDVYKRQGQLMAVLEIPELQAQLEEDQAAIKNMAEQVTHAERELSRVEAQHKVAHLQYDRLKTVSDSKPEMCIRDRNYPFFHRYGFGDFHGGGFEGRGVWAHDPAHRLGVPYPNSALSNRYRGAAGGRATGGNLGNRGAAQGQRSNDSGFDGRSSGANHSAFGGIQGRSQTRQQSDHGYASLGAGRTSFGGGGMFRGGGGMSRGGGGRH